MIPWVHIDPSRVPDSDVELRLMRRGAEFSMMLGQNELMNSRLSGSEEALAILAEDEFAADLVFSDVIMPGMNGVELAVVIRERYPGLPVVLTSGYSSVLAENAHRGFELIQKPYSVEALSRTLRKAISERRALN